VFAVVNSAALFIMALAAAYFFLAAGMGVRQLRRHGTRSGFSSTVGFGAPFQALAAAPSSDRTYHLYFLIPCLNEESVIAGTVAALRPPPGTEARIVVVNDGSDDDTAAVAARAGGDEVWVLTRTRPHARQGKGAALNFGFRRIRSDVADRGLDPDDVIVCVMDADGRLSDGAVAEVLPLFDDPVVGGAQLAVRIRNRESNFLLQFQDHQFWTLSSLTQYGRIRTGTVSLGGNGQFTRLSALLDISDQPWSSSLTEDLDLAVGLAVHGWKLMSTPRAAVDQQGVDRLRPLIRQRTRWYQGHMTEIRRAPQILRSTRMSHAASIEMLLYLLVPWLFDLPWSILYHLILVEIALQAGSSELLSGGPVEIALAIVLWYLLGFWPAIVTALMARRRDPAQSWIRCLTLGHCFVVTNYLSYVCAWRAVYRMVRRRTGWTKTARSTETPAVAPDRPPLAAVGR
jgi:cellulose synthase/poly-beta-1,6-N-acetylglucosamine synthase-like glycosyltransferase